MGVVVDMLRFICSEADENVRILGVIIVDEFDPGNDPLLLLGEKLAPDCLGEGQPIG